MIFLHNTIISKQGQVSGRRTHLRVQRDVAAHDGQRRVVGKALAGLLAPVPHRQGLRRVAQALPAGPQGALQEQPGKAANLRVSCTELQSDGKGDVQKRRLHVQGLHPDGVMVARSWRHERALRAHREPVRPV